jgi:hypothetical protein
MNSKPFKWITYRQVGLHLACSTDGSSDSSHSPICTPQWKQITRSPLPEKDRQVCNIWQVLENSTFKFLRQNKYLTRYFNTKTYQSRKKPASLNPWDVCFKFKGHFWKLSCRIERIQYREYSGGSQCEDVCHLLDLYGVFIAGCELFNLFSILMSARHVFKWTDAAPSAVLSLNIYFPTKC